MSWVVAMQLTVSGLLIFALGFYLGALWGMFLADRIVAEEFERR